MVVEIGCSKVVFLCTGVKVAGGYVCVSACCLLVYWFWGMRLMACGNAFVGTREFLWGRLLVNDDSIVSNLILVVDRTNFYDLIKIFI